MDSVGIKVLLLAITLSFIGSVWYYTKVQWFVLIAQGMVTGLTHSNETALALGECISYRDFVGIQNFYYNVNQAVDKLKDFPVPLSTLYASWDNLAQITDYLANAT